MLRILVCIKQVPNTTEISVDRETGLLNRERAAAVLNPFDETALEIALRIKARTGGDGAEVIALTMGPEAARAVLLDAAGLGVDRCVHLCDAAFRGSDTYATAKILAAAAKKLGPDLIICGRQAIDGDTAQVGPSMAEQLHWPEAAYVTALPQLHPAKTYMTLCRALDGVEEELRVPLPAVITVQKSAAEPRLPSYKLRAAMMDKIERWDLKKLGLAKEDCGLAGSKTRVSRTFTPPPRPLCTMLPEGDIRALRAALKITEGGKA